MQRTAGIVARTLGELGCEVRTGVGHSGVVGLLAGGKPGPTVMLRADMDALPIQEISDAPYVSQTPGVMHACGHDGHVAMGLGRGDACWRGTRPSWPGRCCSSSSRPKKAWAAHAR